MSNVMFECVRCGAEFDRALDRDGCPECGVEMNKAMGFDK